MGLKLKSTGGTGSVQLNAPDSHNTDTTITLPADNVTGGEFVLADGNGDVNIDSGTLYVDAVNDRVGIGSSSPSQLLEVENSSGNAAINITSSDAGYAELYLGDQSDAAAAALSYEHSSNKLRIYNGGSIRATVDSSGQLGIGTTSPEHQLHMANAGSLAIQLEDTSTSTKFRIQNGGSVLKIVETGVAERMTLHSSGNVSIGTGGTEAADSQLYVKNTYASGYAARFFNDGDQANRYGIMVQAGSDSGSGTSTLIQFRDGNGTNIGAVTFTGGTVTYGPFTAHHPCKLPEADNVQGYAYGTLLEITSIEPLTNSEGESYEQGIIYNVRKTQAANSRAVLGAYGASMEDVPDAPDNWHKAYVLGDGHILCNNSGGDIAVGDGICSSAVAGIGQKATVSPSMIIGIAQEAVTFADDTEEKLVAVQYGVQQFIPWSD